MSRTSRRARRAGRERRVREHAPARAHPSEGRAGAVPAAGSPGADSLAADARRAGSPAAGAPSGDSPGSNPPTATSPGPGSTSACSHPLALHATVALSGAAVMVLELIGTRILGPFYGVGLYVWTALIAVTLTALALGYWLGGRLAARAPASGIARALAAAGVLTALVPPASRPVLLATDPLGLRAGALASALVLFLPPLVALGAVGPLAVQRAAGRLHSAGLSAGRVFAVSTAGSVAGTILFGFFLLPVLGARATLLGVSAALLLAAALLWRAERVPAGRTHGGGPAPAARRAPLAVLVSVGSPALLAALGSLTALATLIVFADPPPPAGVRVLFDRESVYGRIRVLDDTRAGLRWLLADASTIGAADLAAGSCPFSYLEILAATPELRPDARRALVVGVGSGFLPTVLHARGLRVDCVELDPAVVQAACVGFGFRPPGELKIGDARQIVRRLPRRYDLVVHDCFTGGAVPSHLLSVEALAEVRRCMRPGGLLALNAVGMPSPGEHRWGAGRRGGSPSVAPARRGARALACVRASLGAVFAHVEALVVDPHAKLSDVIFLASDAPLDPATLASVAARAQGAAARPLALSADPALALTDDENPLDVLQAGLAERYRDLLRERLGPEVLGR